MAIDDAMTPEEADELSIKLARNIQAINHQIKQADELGESPDGFLKEEIEFWEWRRDAVGALNKTRAELYRAMKRRGMTLHQLNARVHQKLQAIMVKHKKRVEASEKRARGFQSELGKAEHKLANQRKLIAGLQKKVEELKADKHQLIREKEAVFKKLTKAAQGGDQ